MKKAAMPVCKWQFVCVPMLMYPKLHSASVLENHHFRHGLPLFNSDTYS
ncbi:hypothetical protein CEV34_0654 [Brucella pseudogrignonensis]|uniref:Uncharacterized protein n=1 Tax=Brucella pseudogrignonensis TaxID=419475 RepID=A0A256GQG5_9HYPH|nr:hypothetical protein CEV34_0654 [Brucella pseudogrignonensis]